MNLERSLLHGYFPAEVPPSFSTRRFAAEASGLTPASKRKWTSPTRFSLARAGGLRRATELPNPLAQIEIATLVSSNWRYFQRLSARSPISISRPVVSRSRSLQYRIGFADKPEAAVSRMPGGKVTLRTDVSQFYPSIYTHAVDWAVRGKASAKSNIHAPHVGRQLDTALQDSRSGQTVGLSIGPETSWLASELVLARVDRAICIEFPGIHKRAFRFIDDMTVFASSQGEAFDVLSRYERHLAEYELVLNPTKTSVIDGLVPPESPWVTSLRQVRYRDDTDQLLVHDLIDLFSMAIDFARAYPTDAVLSYAIKRCDPFPAGKRSWPVYRDLVIASIATDPSTLRHVYAVLIFARAHGLPVDNDRLVETLNEACATHAQLDHGFEVAWLLTILRDLDLPLDSNAALQIATMEDNCSLVLLMDRLEAEPSLQSSIDLNGAVRRAETADALSSPDWLLAYEFRSAGWCAPKKWDSIVQWKELKARGVRFLVPAAITSKTASIRRRRPAFINTWNY